MWQPHYPTILAILLFPLPLRPLLSIRTKNRTLLILYNLPVPLTKTSRIFEPGKTADPLQPHLCEGLLL
jgi:hypothetical protein